MDSFISILGFAFVCILIISANYEQSRHQQSNLINIMLSVMVGLMLFVGLLTLLSSLTPQADSPAPDGATALAFFLLSLIISVFCLGLIFSRRLRRVLQDVLLRREDGYRYYEADSLVHSTALILMAFMIINTLGNFMLAGGVEGIAESLQETSIGANDLLLNMGLYLTAAFLGIGLVLRRNLVQSLERLGLLFSFRQNIKHLLIGILVGFGLFWVQVGMGIIWQSLVSPETLAEQTAATEQIFSALSGSIWLGLLVALTAGIGEELLFRGALQPIFGNLLVSLFFVLMHSQYTLTPASLIILVVSLVFGLLRQNYSTNAAIVAHFVYNFSPFLMIYLASESGLSF